MQRQYIEKCCKICSYHMIQDCSSGKIIVTILHYITVMIWLISLYITLHGALACWVHCVYTVCVHYDPTSFWNKNSSNCLTCHFYNYTTCIHCCLLMALQFTELPMQMNFKLCKYHPDLEVMAVLGTRPGTSIFWAEVSVVYHSMPDMFVQISWHCDLQRIHFR